ncbi:MAG: DUF1572 domain-containing protein [Bacteroidetes bacterium]|nr:DUF1572 domain-containing protein [Bacteroidota bacterium]
MNGRNWTWVDFKSTINDVSWKEADVKIGSLHTIAELTYHIHYFTQVALRVLEGGPLEGDDAVSFNHAPITSGTDWQNFLSNIFRESERFSQLINLLNDSALIEPFADRKYGNYYRNLAGIIEHHHYHLGQIVMLKKLIREQKLVT